MSRGKKNSCDISFEKGDVEIFYDNTEIFTSLEEILDKILCFDISFLECVYENDISQYVEKYINENKKECIIQPPRSIICKILRKSKICASCIDFFLLLLLQMIQMN